MSWRDLIEVPRRVTLPWTGGATVHERDREYRIDFIDRLPNEHGWYNFQLAGRRANSVIPADADISVLKFRRNGYLVGDRIIFDDARVDPDPKQIFACSEQVHLIPDALDRFARVCVGRVYAEGPLIFAEPAFPLGPEDEVSNAYLDRASSVSQIKGVVPALDAAFRMETHLRALAEERRRELERRRAEQEAKRAAEERRRELVRQLGDGAGRRELARMDFEQAARAALTIGGAEYLDHRRSVAANEWIVRYRLDGRRFECVCDTNLQIVDAGICLTDHDGETGDTYFTLESLPGVVMQAIELGVLHVRRRV